jgi:hypothetical protein
LTGDCLGPAVLAFGGKGDGDGVLVRYIVKVGGEAGVFDHRRSN